MESRLGFKPVTQGKRYFISYKRDSSELIRGITHCLDEMGVPMWCDEGIPMDSHWKGIISQNINDCDAMIFFATRDVFSEDSYLRIEYETASRKNKRIYVIKLYPFAESDINVVLETWYTEVMQKQILDIADKHWDDDEIAWDIVKKCNLHFEPQKLLECAFSYLEKEKYAIADKYCDRVLEKDSENGWAYLVKLMSELQVSSMEALGDVDNPLESSAYYQKAVQLLKNEEPSVLLQKYNAQIKADNELKRKTAIYERAKNALEKACSEDDCNAAAKMFRSIAGFKDSDEWVKQSEDKADFARKVVDNERKALGETYLKEEHGVENPQEKNPSGDNNEDNKLDKRDLSDNRGIGKRPIIIVIKKLIMCCISIGFIAMILYLAVSFKTEFEIMNAIEYNDAISSIKEGDYKKAIRLLKGLDYGDSTWVRLAISDVRHQQELAKIGEGSYYVFGSYEQDNDESNGKEDIEWLVLAKEDNRILVTSRFALDAKPYNEADIGVTWETCSLRQWLNATFFEEAFTKKEQEMILSVTVNTEANPTYKTEGGDSTEDKIFLLSREEAESYFNTSSNRKCIPTPYAIGKGVAVGNDLYKSDSALNTAACRWWLRSPGHDSFYAAGVQLDGDCYDYGYNVNIDDDFNLPGFWVSVRPTLWLRL